MLRLTFLPHHNIYYRALFIRLGRTQEGIFKIRLTTGGKIMYNANGEVEDFFKILPRNSSEGVKEKGNFSDKEDVRKHPGVCDAAH